jgi:hypothetical protein
MRKYGLIATQVRLYYPVVVYKTRLSGWPEELVIPSNDWLVFFAARGATIMLGLTVEQFMDATGLAAEEITMHCSSRTIGRCCLLQGSRGGPAPSSVFLSARR